MEDVPEIFKKTDALQPKSKPDTVSVAEDFMADIDVEAEGMPPTEGPPITPAAKEALDALRR